MTVSQRLQFQSDFPSVYNSAGRQRHCRIDQSADIAPVVSLPTHSLFRLVRPLRWLGMCRPFFGDGGKIGFFVCLWNQTPG